MSTAPKHKEVRIDPADWGEYFKGEFKMLKIRRGVNQAETMNKDDIRVLIGEMILECQKPPYNEIEKVVLQRVISDAVLNDQEFFAFTVAWVRKTLNRWWYLSGYKLVEKMQKEKEAKEEQTKPVPQLNPHEDVHQTVTNYVQRLLTESKERKGGMQRVPEVANPEIVGKEWTSQIENKGVAAGFQIDHIKNMQINLQHECYKVAIEGYAHLTPLEKVDFKIFLIDGIYKINCASMQDAEEIYQEAKRRMQLRS